LYGGYKALVDSWADPSSHSRHFGRKGDLEF